MLRRGLRDVSISFRKVSSSKKPSDFVRIGAGLTSQSDGTSSSRRDSKEGSGSTHLTEHIDERQGKGSTNLLTSRDSHNVSSSSGGRELSAEMQAMVKNAHKTFREMHTCIDKSSEHISQIPQRAFFEKYAEHYWKIMGDMYGNGEHADYLAAVDQRIKEIFEHSRLWYRIHPGTLKDVLKSKNPLFKTVHETGKTGSAAFAESDLATKAFQEIRRQLEFVYLNCPQGMDPAKTPLSVYITSHPDGYDRFAWEYGSVALCFKDEVKKRTFGILGDLYMLMIGAQEEEARVKIPDWLDSMLPEFVKTMWWQGTGTLSDISHELAELELKTASSEKLYALPTPLANPTRKCWPMRKWYPNPGQINGSFLLNLENPCDVLSNGGKPVTSYAEGLIDRRKGPVTIDDVEEIVFYNPGLIDDGMKGLLEKHGIAYQFAKLRIIEGLSGLTGLE